ncbi:hypothetical protein [Paenibacillus sp. 1P03SA]|uniref:hypothetical protein n=1 Tax=Paenibacillus sp. 1P03SA TaxID=3132294 RepID=UPI0039A2CB55
MLRQAGFGEIRTTRLVWTEYFSSVKHFLTNIKSLGASTTNAARLPGLSTRHLFSSMFRQYEKDYGVEGRIPVTYEVLLILAV